LLEEKQKLEQLVKSQLAMIDRQSKQIDKLCNKKNELVCEMESDKQLIAELKLQTLDRTNLRVLFSDVSMISTMDRLTAEDPPIGSIGSTIVCTKGD